MNFHLHLIKYLFHFLSSSSSSTLISLLSISPILTILINIHQKKVNEWFTVLEKTTWCRFCRDMHATVHLCALSGVTQLTRRSVGAQTHAWVEEGGRWRKARSGVEPISWHVFYFFQADKEKRVLFSLVDFQAEKRTRIRRSRRGASKQVATT